VRGWETEGEWVKGSINPASRHEYRILTNVSSELLNFVDDELSAISHSENTATVIVLILSPSTQALRSSGLGPTPFKSSGTEKSDSCKVSWRKIIAGLSRSWRRSRLTSTRTRAERRQVSHAATLSCVPLSLFVRHPPLRPFK
jgi:hypothetical protein